MTALNGMTYTLQIYNCTLCHETTSVLYWKPKANKQDNHGAATAAKAAKHEELTSKPKRSKARKRGTAGLILPQPTVAHRQLSTARLSNILQQPSASQASKLNQFLK